MKFFIRFWLVLSFVFIQTSCKNYETSYIPLTAVAQHPNGMQYVGMETCIKCHPEIVKTHLQTPHYKTSEIVEQENLIALITPQNNKVELGDGTIIKIENDNNQIYQSAYAKNDTLPLYQKEMEVAIGSGKKIGQTFLTWEKSSLFQLQASHFSPLNQWINSPGYGSFMSPKRPIFPRCLECHSTYAQPENPNSPSENNRYIRDQIVYGIDCQRCHGPVVEHVTYHQKNPMDAVGKKIIKYSSFSRDQRVDMCALCHEGTIQKNIQKSFSFQPGDRLNQFRESARVTANNTPDVHANQVALLKSSACFQHSETMDCMTCHNPHASETGNAIKFNSICASCHQGVEHQMNEDFKSLKTSFENCISCHMPFQDSSIMKLELEENRLVPVQVRTHNIGVYDEFVRK
ncbi:MAG: hypothetical protein CNC91_04285 [Flavobacteriales bacterium MED-G22]|nr:MAG: hypothetical protein CNC91_04285 [Flavobacteriales bacterium MED-G22]|tara:strand:+ start:2451 stop:3659 length:1209 start_codon:yes stop_codon:yes gene_type:complete